MAAHAGRVLAMRERRAAGLRNPMGWLSLVGLHWLAPGSVAFGSDPANPITLHAERGSVAPIVGSFEMVGDRVLVHPAPGGGLTLAGAPVSDGLELVDDVTGAEEGPTVLEVASLRLYLIARGAGRLGIRVKDTAARALREFEGIESFPVDPAWRVVGRLESAAPGSTIAVPDILGASTPEPTPGDVVFEVGGVAHRLHALEAMPGHLELIFGDETNRHETYGGGRFLETGPVQADGAVEIDFNLAYNPPCVFSPYATCPMPPPGNRLALRVEAGECLPRGGTLHT